MLNPTESWLNNFANIENARKIRKVSQLIAGLSIFIAITVDIFFSISIPHHPEFWKNLTCQNTGNYGNCAYFINHIVHVFDIFQIFTFFCAGIMLSAQEVIFLYIKDKEIINQLYITANSRKIFSWRPVSQNKHYKEYFLCFLYSFLLFCLSIFCYSIAQTMQ